MSTPTNSQNEVKNSSQEILNRSFDPDFQAIVVEAIETNPAGTAAYRKVTGDLAFQFVTSGTDLYVGHAVIGSATSAAVWRISKFSTASGIQRTWADGNANFDNIWDNYASLSYS